MGNSNSDNIHSTEPNVEGTTDYPASTCSFYKLFSCQGTSHQMVGGEAADVKLWRRYRVLFDLVVATLSWLLIEHAEIQFLSLYSDVLLILFVLLVLQPNYAAYRNKINNFRRYRS